MKLLARENLKKMQSAAIFLVAALIVVPKIAHFCHHQTEGFTLLSVSSNRDINPDWEIAPLEEIEKIELDYALSQNYSYLTRGSQAFVFISEDGEYVLKFFVQQFFGPPYSLHMAPKWIQSFYPEKKMAKRINKLHRDFNSYKLAFDEMREETGLVLVHLNKSNWLKKIQISDKLNIVHEVDLDKMDFILQKKAKLVYPTIEGLLDKEDIEGAKKALSGLLQLLSSRCKKGIADSTPDIDKNFGYLDDKAVQIDIGKFCKDPSLLPPSHNAYISKNRGASEIHVAVPIIREEFKAWLFSVSPELLEYFNSEFERLVREEGFSFDKSKI